MSIGYTEIAQLPIKDLAILIPWEHPSGLDVMSASSWINMLDLRNGTDNEPNR